MGARNEVEAHRQQEKKRTRNRNQKEKDQNRIRGQLQKDPSSVKAEIDKLKNLKARGNLRVKEEIRYRQLVEELTEFTIKQTTDGKRERQRLKTAADEAYLSRKLNDLRKEKMGTTPKVDVGSSDDSSSDDAPVPVRQLPEDDPPPPLPEGPPPPVASLPHMRPELMSYTGLAADRKGATRPVPEGVMPRGSLPPGMPVGGSLPPGMPVGGSLPPGMPVGGSLPPRGFPPDPHHRNFQRGFASALPHSTHSSLTRIPIQRGAEEDELSAFLSEINSIEHSGL
ncbi:MAG: uncharacterized protein KVP18_004348 [Porospora cf. gigantea A]|uniref:uncharacterized protein n=1 Tax=Porospora cf. gigantea A TaxID=2853593 RepID=UPI00355A39BF|nr:MAG: hypothetical protein KVP18_004348 [Porospora cf. gigantea A]